MAYREFSLSFSLHLIEGHSLYNNMSTEICLGRNYTSCVTFYYYSEREKSVDFLAFQGNQELTWLTQQCECIRKYKKVLLPFGFSGRVPFSSTPH